MMMNNEEKNTNLNQNEIIEQNEINEKKMKSGKMKKVIKKGASISLCAVLAGGLAAGAFHGVNALTGWNEPTQVSAASQDNEVQLLKTKVERDSSDAEEETTTTAKSGMDVSDIAEEAMPSVVSITTQSLQEVQNYFGYFQYGNGYSYAPQQREVEGSGSGIIVGKNDESLLVVTNYHVIEGADTVSVSFIDGSSLEATVNGYDEGRDLAVVSIPLDDISDDTLEEISIATIGSSDDLKVGEQVVAIGNALGYGQSVTTGIVSAKNRRLDDSTSYVSSDDAEDEDGVNLIQTDAAINPGNSGGALLNMNGEVVGINSAKMASTEVEGMGYAIAISDVSDVLEQLMNETPREKVEDRKHGILGITGATVSDEGVQLYDMPQGVYVKEVTEGGAADKAGIKKNSIITEFDGKRVKDIQTLVDLLEYYEPGEEVEVTIEVLDGEGYDEKTVTVTLDENTEEDSDNNDEDSDEGKAGSSDENLFEDWENNKQNQSYSGMERFFQQW